MQNGEKVTFKNVTELYSEVKGIRINAILSGAGWVSHKVVFNIEEELKALKNKGVKFVQLTLEFAGGVERSPEFNICELFEATETAEAPPAFKPLSKKAAAFFRKIAIQEGEEVKEEVKAPKKTKKPATAKQLEAKYIKLYNALEALEEDEAEAEGAMFSTYDLEHERSPLKRKSLKKYAKLEAARLKKAKLKVKNCCAKLDLIEESLTEESKENIENHYGVEIF